MHRTSALIIDDDDFMTELMKEYLHEANVPKIHSANNGKSAINLIQSLNPTPNLLLLDINLPIMDGYQVIDQLAHLNFQGLIILISGTNQNILSSAQLLARWKNLHVGNYLIKPFSNKQLINTIKDNLHKILP